MPYTCHYKETFQLIGFLILVNTIIHQTSEAFCSPLNVCLYEVKQLKMKSIWERFQKSLVNFSQNWHISNKILSVFFFCLSCHFAERHWQRGLFRFGLVLLTSLWVKQFKKLPTSSSFLPFLVQFRLLDTHLNKIWFLLSYFQSRKKYYGVIQHLLWSYQ